MKKTFRSVWLAAALALLFVVPASAQNGGWGQVRTASTSVNLRVKPDSRSLLLRVLQPGTRVKVDFFKPGGWCALFDVNEPARDETKALGYAPCSQLAVDRPATVTAAPPSRNAAVRLRQVTAKTAVRRARKATSKVVAVLMPGERIRTGFAGGGYVAVFRRADPAARESSAIGYVPEADTQPVGGRAAFAAPRPAAGQASASRRDGSATAGRSARKASSRSEPVHITSDRMIYNQDANTVVFLGKVHGTQGDMAIWADKVTAFFAKKTPSGGKEKASSAGGGEPGEFNTKIDRIVAEGTVRMVSGKNEGACGLLTYYVKEGMLRMDRNPILREGKNIIRGDVIKHYIHENRSEVLSGAKRRVEAIFSPDKGAQR